MNPFVKNILHEFKFRLAILAGPEFQEKSYLVAVSGGADSMALATMAIHCDLNVRIAHCNFNLRGEESDLDEDFVKDYFDRLEIPVYVASFPTKNIAKERGKSVQVTARELRYDFFEKLCQENNLNFIMTAHHRNDSLETFFINLSRGSGPAGLSGIPAFNGNIIRPLLSFDQYLLQHWLSILNIPHREDTSNQDLKYKRNVLRKEIIPRLTKEFSGFTDNVMQSIQIIQSYHHYVENRAKAAIETTRSDSKWGTNFSFDKLQDPELWPFVARHFLSTHAFSSTAISDLNRAIQVGKSGISILSSQGGKAVSDRNGFVFLPEEPVLNQRAIDIADGAYITDFGIFRIKKSVFRGIGGLDALFLPVHPEISKIVVRNRKDGDRISPFGMSGSQKLQDVYTNARLNYLEKQIQPVVTISDEIIWLPGLKRSKHFRVESGSEAWQIIWHKEGQSAEDV